MQANVLNRGAYKFNNVDQKKLKQEKRNCNWLKINLKVSRGPLLTTVPELEPN